MDVLFAPKWMYRLMCRWKMIPVRVLYVCRVMCGWGFAFSASWWEVTWQPVTCDLSWAHSAPPPPCRTPSEPWDTRKKLTFTHLLYTGGSCQSACEPFRWKITRPNQLLIETLSSGGAQSEAQCASPRNKGNQLLVDVRLMLIPFDDTGQIWIMQKEIKNAS